MQAVRPPFPVRFSFLSKPRYLVRKGRLTRRGGCHPPVGEVVPRPISFESRTLPRRPRPAFPMLAPRDGLFGMRPIVWVAYAAVFQQLVGINVIFYYGATLWQLAGFTEADSLLINIVSGVVSIAACFITIAFIDKIGRKPLLLIGSAGMAVTLFVMVFAFSQGTLDAGGDLELSTEMGIVAVVAANLYVIFFNVSWGPVMWVMLGEMFPNQIRGSGLAVAGAAQWTANFAITMSFPVMLAGIGLAGAYGLYTLAAVLSVFFVLRYVHETKGRELEQMEG